MDHQLHRERLLRSRLPQTGVTDDRVLQAMAKVPREKFVAREFRSAAYADFPLPIGEFQTISQPSLVAQMTQQLHVDDTCRVLEIGTGSGYQTAILAELAGQVYTIEFREGLSRAAQKTLKSLNYRNVHFKVGDGSLGWPEFAPYDRIIVTASPPNLPEDLIAQLKVGGRMVIPLGTDDQHLYLIEKTVNGYEPTRLFAVSFVPMESGEPVLSPDMSTHQLSKGDSNAKAKVRSRESKSKSGARSKLRTGTPGVPGVQ